MGLNEREFELFKIIGDELRLIRKCMEREEKRNEKTIKLLEKEELADEKISD